MKKYIVFLFVLFINSCSGQDTLKMMFYNLFRFPTSPPMNREFLLKKILTEYTPDLFMVCELVTKDGADKILKIALQVPDNDFSSAVFEPIQSLKNPADNEILQQLVFYNNSKLVLLKQKVLPTIIRDINYYIFKLNIGDENTPLLHVFITHLKSGTGPINRKARFDMINVFINELNTIPIDHYILFAGDLNISNTDKEPAYLKIIDKTNSIIMIDPINKPGNWHKNNAFTNIHTQSTRTSNIGFGIGGAAGGLNDRFDVIMMSENLQKNENFYYIENTYKAFGNNHNCWNNRIDAEDCHGNYSIDLRKNLHNMSDHLPVIMEFYSRKSFIKTK